MLIFLKAPKEVMKEFKNAPNSHTKGFLKAAEAEFSKEFCNTVCSAFQKPSNVAIGGF
jgi:hypothetical protein